MLIDNEVVWDIEIYKNYFLLKFKRLSDGKIRGFEVFKGVDENESYSTFDRQQILRIVSANTMVGFNSLKFDLPILSAMMVGWDLERVKDLCDHIIENRAQPWQLRESHNLRMIDISRHIDLIEVAPLVGSLKKYGARLGGLKLQELPIEPSATILVSEISGLNSYCDNDLADTESLFNYLRPQVDLRLKMDSSGAYLSKSDAQVAEAVIKVKIPNLIKSDKVPKLVKYKAPENIKFKTPIFKNALWIFENTEIDIVEHTGRPDPEPFATFTVAMNDKEYKLGLGGIHSKDKRAQHTADDDELLVEVDAVAYYPWIILRNGIFPKNIGPEFLEVYAKIVDDRMVAKSIGDKVSNESLKIVINGLFGKFGSWYSIVYSPELLLQTTITGQLMMMMLIEEFELNGIPILSANTDGVLVKTKDVALLRQITADWEQKTQHALEESPYKQINYQNVNNYIALGTNGKFKGKGAFVNRNTSNKLSTNPSCDIIVTAIENHIRDDIPIEMTIRDCNKVDQFVAIRTVNGGAIKDGVPLGKLIRWYYGQTDTAIHYVKNGNKVPKSDGAVPLMDMTGAKISDLNLDYSWYINETSRQLKLLGVAA